VAESARVFLRLIDLGSLCKSSDNLRLLRARDARVVGTGTTTTEFLEVRGAGVTSFVGALGVSLDDALAGGLMGCLGGDAWRRRRERRGPERGFGTMRVWRGDINYVD